MTKTPFTVRDLLYLDFDKAASIWSQFEEGLLERVSVTEDTGKDRTAGAKFGIPSVAEANLGVDYQQKRSTLQSRTLHHDVLNRVERGLEEAGLITDLSTRVSGDESSPQKIRAVIGKRPYLRAEGASVLEDYRRILSISEKFNDILTLIEKAIQEGVKKSPQYVKIQELVAAANEAAEAVSDRNQKATQRAKAKEMQRQLDALSKPPLSNRIDEWLLNGMRLWINTFMPSRINFRIYPFANCPSFQVLCNLKRECFVDADLEHLLYGYGNRPNVPLAVFGLITSIPDESGPTFDPMKEFETNPELSERAAFEKGFRGVFAGMEGMEAFARYSRYPNVTVHPIAVYRSFPADVTKT
jgi:hypothetical protein